MNIGLTLDIPHRTTAVSAQTVQLNGDLVVPPEAQGVVLIIRERNTIPPRHHNLAELLYQVSLATLTIDLLTPDEAAFDQRTRELRFDAVGLLANRVVGATDWLRHTPATQGLPIGYFGEGPSGAAVLAASAKQCSTIKAVVARGGWLDLIWATLTQVYAPTLLIVGGRDLPMITVNEEAMFLMDKAQEKHLEIISGASHRFIEPDTLEQAETTACQWFQRFLYASTKE